jgi:6-pyruvoyltetrahydropterin/6-carboxytetrahydropterin synthase
MVKIEKKYHFYGAHRNLKAGEKCGRIHGHTYEIECIFEFKQLNEGVSMLFSDIDSLVEPIIKEHCHYLLLHEKDSLCDLFEIAGEPFLKLPFETSAENLAIWLATRILNETNLPIVEIRLAETKSSKVIFNVAKIDILAKNQIEWNQIKN